MTDVTALKAKILKPMEVFAKHSGETTDPDINPNYIRPRMFMFRLAEDHGRVRRWHQRTSSPPTRAS